MALNVLDGFIVLRHGFGQVHPAHRHQFSQFDSGAILGSIAAAVSADLALETENYDFHEDRLFLIDEAERFWSATEVGLLRARKNLPPMALN